MGDLITLHGALLCQIDVWVPTVALRAARGQAQHGAGCGALSAQVTGFNRNGEASPARALALKTDA